MQEILSQCRVEGTTVFLPDQQLDRKTYTEVAKALEGIGGKWNRKAGGFVFPHDPTELLAKIQGGDKINLKKEYQFFGTPEGLADYLAELADIQDDHIVLEPSAGQGALVKAIRKVSKKCQINAVELMPQNAAILRKMGDIDHVNVIEGDFLEYEINSTYKPHRIVANPPFAKNQDVDHIRKMWYLLRNGGRIVTIASNHWRNCDNSKEVAFREWLYELDVRIFDVPAGSFKESGTNVAACIIIIDK